jgi:hypothetical protein
MTDERSYDWADNDYDDTDFGDLDSQRVFLFLAFLAIVAVLVIGGILFAITMTAGHPAQVVR